MNIKNIGYFDILYPVGKNIGTNLPEMEKLFYAFLNEARIDLEDDNDYINFIGRGSSGLIMCSVFSQHLIKLYPTKDIRIIHIPKRVEGHFDMRILLTDKLQLNIFVDDFTSTGKTLFGTATSIRERMGPNFMFDYVVLGGDIRSRLVDRMASDNVTKNLVGCTAR